MKIHHLIIPLACFLSLTGCTSDHWINLFDGETFEGWKASEDPASWKIEDGALVTAGARSHLFYMGDVMDHNFTNFEFSVDVLTNPVPIRGFIFIPTIRMRDGPLKVMSAR